MDLVRRIYLVFVFMSVVVLVFYLGFLYGAREIFSRETPTIEIGNPNSFEENSISNIEERDVFGVANDGANVIKKRYGTMYFMVNSDGHIEFSLRLDSVPISLRQPATGIEVFIPEELSVDYAVRTNDIDDGLETYEYINVSDDLGQKRAILKLSEVNSRTRQGRYDDIIKRSTTDNKDRNIERIVLRSIDANIQNIFIDGDKDLPIKIRGNQEATPPIPGQPAPFFWVDF